MYQVILNMFITKDLDNKVLEHIYPWGETLAYITWAIKAYYYRTVQSTPGQNLFGTYMIFNLAPIVDWQVITTAK